MRILLVEDDRRIAEPLAEALTSQHYIVDIAEDGQQGWELVEAFDYNLLLLDVMLPKLDGISLCKQVRAQGYQMPILILTAQDTTPDQVSGLDAGADDYVLKPYKLQEVSARIRALLRRGNTSLPAVLEWGRLRLDPNTCEVSYGDSPLPVTPKEYRLLELFLRSSSSVLSRRVIIENLWSFEEPPDEDSVKAHIKRLRQKFKGVGAPDDFIETVYGMGYRLNRNL
jgi:two-component system, OmpR family, response regulator